MAVVLAGRCCLDVYRLKQVQIKIIVVISFIAPAAASVKHRSGVRPSVFPVGRILTATYHSPGGSTDAASICLGLPCLFDLI